MISMISDWEPLSNQELTRIHNVVLYNLQTNLVKNPDFESVSGSLPTYWTNVQIGTTNPSTLTYPAVGITGNGVSVAYSTYALDNSAEWKQDITGIKSGSTYTLSAYIKTDNIVVPAGVAGGAKIFVNWIDSTGTNIGTSASKVVVGTNNWAQYSIDVPAIANAVTARIALGLQKCTGTVTFDDISFVLTTPACAILTCNLTIT